MKSGLEDRNNASCCGCPPQCTTSVSMKSGLEDRNNAATSRERNSFWRVSMKSGLEDRNNSGLLRI